MPSLVVLLVAAVALLAFIGVLGDVRRQRNVLRQGERYAAAYAERAGGTGILPLNLEPEAADETDAEMIRIDWLRADEARLLRKSSERVIVARTAPVVQALGRDGRVVIFFEDGRFDACWLTLSQFDELNAAQRAEIQRCARLE